MDIPKDKEKAKLVDWGNLIFKNGNQNGPQTTEWEHIILACVPFINHFLLFLVPWPFNGRWCYNVGHYIDYDRFVDSCSDKLNCITVAGSSTMIFSLSGSCLLIIFHVIFRIRSSYFSRWYKMSPKYSGFIRLTALIISSSLFMLIYPHLECFETFQHCFSDCPCSHALKEN